MPMRLLHVAEILAESVLEPGWDHAVQDRGLPLVKFEASGHD